MIFHATKGYVLTASMAVNCSAQRKGSIDNMSVLPLANSSVTGLMSVSLAWFKFDATGKLNVRKSRSEKKSCALINRGLKNSCLYKVF